MKIITILLFSLINISILSQNLKNNLSIGFNYNDNKLKTYSGVLNITTNYQKNWLAIDNVLNENISFTNKINQNEPELILIIGEVAVPAKVDKINEDINANKTTVVLKKKDLGDSSVQQNIQKLGKDVNVSIVDEDVLAGGIEPKDAFLLGALAVNNLIVGV